MATQAPELSDAVDEEDYSAIADRIERRGHAKMHARWAGKIAEEFSVIQDWVESFTRRTKSKVGNPRLGADPPDFVVEIGGIDRSVELVEFVDESLLREIARFRSNEAHPDRPAKTPFLEPKSQEHYQRAQWTEHRFHDELGKTITRKVDRHEIADTVPAIDFLLVYTDEDWLLAPDVQNWLSTFELPRLDKIKEVHFMMSYSPGFSSSYPLFILRPEPQHRP